MTNEQLFEIAGKIKDEGLRENAVSFLNKMTEVIEGIGDKPIEWRPSGLKVVQSMSDTDKLPSGAKAGDLVLGDDIVKDDLLVFPLRVWDSRVMWHEDTDRNEIICQSPDGRNGYRFGNCFQCPHSKYREGEGVDCNKTKNFMVVKSDLSDVFVCNFAKSQYAMGMDWESTMRKMKTHPYNRQYKLSTENHPKYKKVKALVASPTRETLDEDVREFLAALFERIREDREKQLESFSAYLEKKEEGQGNPALENRSVGEDDPVKTIGVEAADGEADPDSKTYTV